MNKLQGKDLINVGIFTAIYFVVMMAIAMLGFIPIFLPLLIVLVPLIGGIVMMLYYSKVQKLAHVVSRKPLGKLGVFFLGHACFDYPAAVRRVVSFHRWLTSFLCVVSSH